MLPNNNLVVRFGCHKQKRDLHCLPVVVRHFWHVDLKPWKGLRNLEDHQVQGSQTTSLLFGLGVKNKDQTCIANPLLFDILAGYISGNFTFDQEMKGLVKDLSNASSVFLGVPHFKTSPPMVFLGRMAKGALHNSF